MAYSPVAILVSARTVFTGGAVDAHMVDVTMNYGQKKIHMIRSIQINHHEQYGATGINPENRHIGAGAEGSIQNITVRDLLSIMDPA